jgi:spermidine synthase
LLFVFSGATGLIDQLCFSKYLSYVVGSTAHAISAVLAAFMTGLALGAYLGGRISARITRPLAAYGVLELIVAAAVAASPLAFRMLTPLYAALSGLVPDSLAAASAVRWLLAVLFVVVPTTAMGATLPLLSRSLGADTDDAEAQRLRERRLAALYATNTLGGALGALGAAYAIVPALGIAGTLWLSAALSAIVGALAIAFGRGSRLPASPENLPQVEIGSGARSLPADRALLTALAFASGWLVFSCEVLFTHLLALIIGNSAYAFGIILAIFLLCLFFGASRAARVETRFGAAALPLGLAAAGLALALTLPAWDHLPLLFGRSGEVFSSFTAREAVRAAVAFGVLVLPTSLMGLTFPLLLQRVAGSAHVGQLVGRLTAVNTIGAVTGSLATGYLLLPLLGSQGSLVAIALCFAFAAVFVVAKGLREHRSATLVLAGLAALTALVMPRWDLLRLTSGTNVYFDEGPRPDALLFVREDALGGVTTVSVKGGVHTLYTNGKFQGNDGWEMQAQRSFAHYPSLFVPRFDKLLVIGLGTGTTLGTFAAYPWREMHVAEISPAIVEAARLHFSGVNGASVDDPRVRMHLVDGRNHLLVGSERYDLISMELSSVWFAGAANLYSREYYQVARRRLTQGGVLQQWVQLHHIRRQDFATILNTLRLEFPHVALLYGGGQGILIASESPLEATISRARKLGADPEIARTLPDERPLEALLSDVLVVDAGFESFLEDVARQAGVARSELLSTDDNLYLEYATPRGNVLPWSTREELVAELLTHRDERAIWEMATP